jgi:hypothetical protein
MFSSTCRLISIIFKNIFNIIICKMGSCVDGVSYGPNGGYYNNNGCAINNVNNGYGYDNGLYMNGGGFNNGRMMNEPFYNQGFNNGGIMMNGGYNGGVMNGGLVNNFVIAE